MHTYCGGTRGAAVDAACHLDVGTSVSAVGFAPGDLVAPAGAVVRILCYRFTGQPLEAACRRRQEQRRDPA